MVSFQFSSTVVYLKTEEHSKSVEMFYQRGNRSFFALVSECYTLGVRGDGRVSLTFKLSPENLTKVG